MSKKQMAIRMDDESQRLIHEYSEALPAVNATALVNLMFKRGMATRDPLRLAQKPHRNHKPK